MSQTAQANGIRDVLNPKFVYHTTVHPDELDSRQRLVSSRLVAHVERAIADYAVDAVSRPKPATDDSPDQFHDVRELRVDFLVPVAGPCVIRIDVWVERLTPTSCVYGFLCSSPDGNIAYARGERTIVKVDPLSHRPAPWSAAFREKHAFLLKDLPSLA